MLHVQFFVFNPVQENTYILYNDKKHCCIIDPGCYFAEERDELRSAIEKKGLSPLMLLNTHCHLDHVFGNQFVYDTWKLSLQIHAKEKPVLDFAPQAGQLWQLPFENYSGPIEYLQEGSVISLDGEELEIRWVPGHSPGSILFYHAAGDFVISGDVLFNMSVGRTDLPGGDFDTLEQSIRTQLYTLPDETIVYSGHGSETTIGFEKENNPFVKVK